ncbi:TrkA C-terminal domain-containing protein [Halalkalicoccus sp. NIPERK01]|uniref:TrkA C-terminal domain-containing protein n=1 Tax=Halalkalicoccus sp. NIPERK01 TaxID=3053469 RepID=UPI00256F0D3C|nr:TrkA C-terminal domain-containing protein [Halalkalicoccus sp. NIPERK01]MDL5363195.1 TrkA C-terminal domain-containing protein [Halalkalicoccus sp. NIPERK01]
MVATYPILSLLVIFALSLLIVRVGSIALEMTGLSPDVASFQATSAFSGAGYTTEEAEQTVATAGRRKTVKALIRLGSIGLLGAISSLILSFTQTSDGHLLNLAYILGGAGVIILFARSRWFNRIVTPFIEWALSRTTELEVRDYAQLLGLQSEYRVAEVDIEASDWLAEKTLAELDLPSEGVLVLGVMRNGSYIGAPQLEMEMKPDDTLVLYGKRDRLQELSDRQAGDTEARDDAIEDHEETLEQQKQLIEQ